MAEERSDVEQRVLLAARKAFFSQGVGKTPLRTVATSAGTSESGILRFFQDKNDLVRAVMDSCWTETNETIAESLGEASRKSDDPRFLLVEVVAAVLRHAAADMEATSFIVNHFPYAMASGADEEGPAGRSSRLDGYRRYRQTIEGLCSRITADYPAIVEAGITQAGLCHLTLSLVHGITGGWYMSEHDPAIHGPKVSLEEALAVLRVVLYGNGTSSKV